MRRRELLVLLSGAVASWPVVVSAQVAGGRPLIVWFGSATRSAATRWMGFFQEGLKELGYIEGQDYELVDRYAEYQVDRLPAVAAEVVALKPTVIVAGAVDTAVAARKITSTIPIVSGALADAQHLGLIDSYSRPGGNVTGITPYIANLPAKQMELACEVVPGARKVGLIGNVNDPKAPPQRDELEGVAKKLGITVLTPKVDTPDDLSDAVGTLAKEHVDVVIVLETTMLLAQRREIALLLAANRLPAVYGYRDHADSGGLISYGVDLSWCWRRVATYVVKILSGAAPGDLPVEFPPKLQMVVNLSTAKALGLTIPQSIVGRADEVIE
jgi:putative tryptophan/tyrosine transport system substrate-binding protein